MSIPILATKLYIPPPRPHVVPRPRLIERLNAGLHSKLTLISAPAGFGKTTLMSEWIAVCERPVAWLSLDDRDNDPARFLTYLIAALQTIAASIGDGLLSALGSSQQPTPDSILTALLNDIAAFPDSFILVLDDLHVLDASPVLTFLVEHLPPQMHLVISTRKDPPLPLARLRARRQLTELRDTDLRFTLDETIEFLNQVMGLKLSKDHIVALETRTEGWIAGLQLAALALQGTISIQGHHETTRFIESFTGNHHFVLDYLVEEVLQQQSEHVQMFLLWTSIFDRLCGPLCEAVLQDSSVSGQDTLEYLNRANLFIIPLDHERHWYRYHHLFAEALRTRLMKEHSDQISVLHQRASLWYEQHGLRSDAIHHALAAKDFERAAELIELAWPTVDGSLQSTLWLGWVRALPDALVRNRPVLSVDYAWALMSQGAFDASESRLQDAEQWLQPGTHLSQMVVVDDKQFAALPALITIARAYHAQALGDIPGTISYARQVLDLLQEQDPFRRGQATALLGLAYWASGELELAQQYVTDFMATMQRIGSIPEVIEMTFVLADIKRALGRLHEAFATYQHSLKLAEAPPTPALPGIADLHRGISELHCEWGHLDAAEQHLQTSKALGERDALLNWQSRFSLAQAQIRQSQRDLDGALNLLDEAERLYMKTPLPEVRPLAASKARIWIVQGRLNEAVSWARQQHLSIDDDLSYLREFEHITLVRVLIAQYRHKHQDGTLHQAMTFIERLLEAADEGHRRESTIELLMLKALAYAAQGSTPMALMALEHALTLAESEGYVRLFVDEGQPMADLLRETAKQGSLAAYARRLQSAFGTIKPKTSIPQPVLDPLSERELDVLRRLASELSGPEIATELMVSLNTLRTHTKNIYSKLGVNNRRTAVRRAEDLDLL